MATKKEMCAELLKKLATDDDLRERLVKDPVDVLKEYGVDISKDKLPDHIRLPEKEEIAKNLDIYFDQLKDDDLVYAPVHDFLK